MPEQEVPTPTPSAQPVPTPPVQRTEEDVVRETLQNLFLDLVSSAQKLSYELATLDPKDSYNRDELKDLFDAAKEVVVNIKRIYRFLEKHGRRRPVTAG